MKDYMQKLSELDDLIKAGKGFAVRKELKATPLNALPRNLALGYAHLARRVQLPLLSMKILRPIVKPKTPVHPPATASEQAAYAAVLVRVGAIHEAAEMFSDLSGQEDPQIYFFKCYAYFAKWEYNKAIPELKRYIKSPITDYQKLVGKVNLAAAYVAEDDPVHGLPLLQELIKETLDKKLYLLLGNCLELSAQLSFAEENYDECMHSLDQAAKLLKNTKSSYAFYVEKWQTLVELMTSKNPTSSIKNIDVLKQKAHRIRSWETLRQIDIYKAKILNDENLFLKAYFGTPFFRYRKKIKSIMDLKTSIPKSHLWALNSKTSPYTFDSLLGVELHTQASVKPGQAIHRLFMSLSEDFYNPSSLGQLFSHVFREEFFHPESSPQKVNQIIGRTRKWLKANCLPLKINVHSNEFNLSSSEGFKILVPVKMNFNSSEFVQIQRLKSKITKNSFTAEDIGQTLGISPRTTSRLLASDCAKKLLIQKGHGMGKEIRFK